MRDTERDDMSLANETDRADRCVLVITAEGKFNSEVFKWQKMYSIGDSLLMNTLQVSRCSQDVLPAARKNRKDNYWD